MPWFWRAKPPKTWICPSDLYIGNDWFHNSHVVEAFEDEGIITLDGANRLEILEKIDKGTVIFTAHGFPPKSAEVRAPGKRFDGGGSRLVPGCDADARLIREKTAAGYEVIYIGKQGHPEPEGAWGGSREGPLD